MPLNQGVVIDKPLQHSFWDKCKEFFDQAANAPCLGPLPVPERSLLRLSRLAGHQPVSVRGPRALTEVKPLFIFQGAPSSNPIFSGGNAEYYGLQARLAITERLSFTFNELGFVTLNPYDSAAGPTGKFSQSTGFAELTLGPKYTFLRSEEWKTVMAGGLLFQIPAGSPSVFQNTGTLGLVPYVSAAKNFCLPSGWGSINLMGNTGFSVLGGPPAFGVLLPERSRRLQHRQHQHVLPVPGIELVPLHAGRLGEHPGFGFEGLDLANFGSHKVGGRDFLALSPGLRFKINEHIQAGAAVSWPLLNQKEINDYRLTFDIIFRY